MNTTTFRAATLFSSFVVIISALFCGCGTNPQQSVSEGGTAIGPADAPGTLLSTVEDPQFGTYQLIAQGEDPESGKWNFLVRAARGGAKGQLRFVWDFGDGPEAEGTQQTHSFTSNGTYAIKVSALQADNSVAFVLKLTIEVVVDPNLAPVADSGADQFVNANDLVFLFGGNSSDPNNDEITYEWTQTFGPAVAILHALEASASFVAPLVTLDTDLVFRLTVSDGVAAGHGDVIVHVKPLLDPAGIDLQANAGTDQQVGLGTTVNLSGSATPADLTTTFVWTQLQGPSVILSGANLATAKFVAPAVAATLAFELVATLQDVIATDEILVTVNGGVATDPCAVDADHDSLYDCVAGCSQTNCDQCPSDPRKGAPQQCGCGVPDTDSNGNGTPDCLDCVTSTPSWTTSSFLAQSGVFTAQFDATPNASLMDGTIGLSRGAGSTFSSFAVLVRFNPSGTIDARNGGSYGAATTVPYAANQQFHFRLVVSVSAHTYDTYVTPQGGAEVQLGRGYAFRTEQNAVTSLDNLGVMAAVGTMLQVCGFAISGPEPVANAGADVTIVMGASTPLSGSATGGTPPYTYLWSPSTGLTNVRVPNPTASPSATTAYSLLVTDSLGATASDTVTVTVQTLVALVANAGADRTIAPGGSVVLSGSATGGTPPYTYSWSPPTGLNSTSIASPTASPSATTTYTLTVTDSQSRTATDTMQTTVTLVANAGPDRQIAPGGSVVLSGSATGGTPPYTYSWSPATGLNNANVASPTASPSATTTYTLTVTDGRSGAATDSAMVTVTATTAPGFWYVDTNNPVASDTGQGTEASPFKTIQKAANIVSPGDTVIVKAGTYLTIGVQEGSNVLEITRNGSAASPITFRAFQQQDGTYDTVILDSVGIYSYSAYVHNCSYVVLDGLTFVRGKKGGLLIGGGADGTNPIIEPADHITVKNCVAYDNGAPGTWQGAFTVYAASHDILFDRCEAHDNGSGFWIGLPHWDVKADLPYNVVIQYCYAYDHTKGGGNSMGFVHFGAHNSTISHCVAKGNSDTGAGSQGPHCDDNLYEYVVAYNATSGGNGRGFQFNNTNAPLNTGSVGGANNVIRNCIAYDNARRGFVDGNGSLNARYLNCIAYRNGRDPNETTGWGFLFESEAGNPTYPQITRGATVKNCISYATQRAADLHGGAKSVYDSDYNLIGDGLTLGSMFSNAAWDQHSLSGNPGFANINPTTDTALWIGDPRLRIPNPHFGVVAGLELLNGSKCIDAGADVGQTFTPIDGNGDGQAKYDIDVYEFSP